MVTDSRGPSDTARLADDLEPSQRDAAITGRRRAFFIRAAEVAHRVQTFKTYARPA